MSTPFINATTTGTISIKPQQQVEEDSVDIIFHGIPYNLSVTVAEYNQPEPILCIDLENLTNTNENWHGEFSSSYIENITSKTGSFKRFNVLVKMLMGALRQQTEAVFLDLLTYSDLEALRSKKNNNNTNTNGKPSNTGTSGKSPTQGPGMNKRYLILTYVVEFDRVHYPLPLTFEETPTVSVYQRLTRRLRRELLTYKSLAGLTESQVGITATGLPNSASNALSTSVAGLQRENTVLRQMLVEQENKERIAQETIRTLEGKIIGLQDTVNAGDTAIEKLRLASRAEVKRLRQEIQEYQQKLGITSGTDNHYSGGGNNSNDSDNNNNNKDLIHQLKDTNEQLKLRIQDLTKQLALSTSSSNKENSSNTNRGRTAARTPTSNNHQLGPQNSTSSLSRRSISNTSRGLSPSGSVQSNRSGSNVHNRLSQASSIYGNTRNPTPTRRTTTTNGTVTPTNNSSTRNRTPTNNNNNNRTPTSVYGTPNSIGNNGPRNGVRSTSNSRTPKSTTGTPSGTNGNVRSSSRSTNPASSASRTTSNNPQRSVTPSGRSVSSQHSQASPSNNNHQRSQISQSSKTRTPTGNRANIASPYLTGVEPILATMERNYKQRNESHNSNSKTTTPIGSRNNGQQQKQQQSTIYGSGNNNSSKGSSSSRGPSPARTIHNGTIHKTSSSSTSTTVVPAPPPAPMMVRNTNTTNTLSVVTEPPVIPRTAWTDTNENIGGSSVNYIQPNGESGSSSRGGSGSGTVSPGGTKYSYDSSAEMHDIDTRLQQLQDFLKAAKSGGPLPNVQI